MKKDTKGLKRRSMMLSADCIETIVKLRAMLDATSDSEVIRRSLRVFYSLLVADPNSEVIIRDKETGKEKLFIIV